MAKGVEEADLVIICTPVDRIVDDVRRAAKHAPEGTLITDTGSTKLSIVEELDGELARGCRFLGSHPMAGSEKIGPAHASADLFEGRVTVITPTRNTQAHDFDRIEHFWVRLGSMVIQMSAEEHDRAVALISHLPHAVAGRAGRKRAGGVFPPRRDGPVGHDAARRRGGPRSGSRSSISTATTSWRALEHYQTNLDSLRDAIRAGDEAELDRILTIAKKNRDALGS